MNDFVFNILLFFKIKAQKLRWAYHEFLVKQLKKEKGNFFRHYNIRGNQNLDNGIVIGEFGARKFVMKCKLNDEIEGRMLVTKIWDRPVLELIVSMVERRPGAIIDIGANVGAIAIPASIVFPDRKIYCLEPHPDISKRLEENIRLNSINNITIEKKAASDSVGEISFFAQTLSDNMGLSSILEGAVKTGNKKITVESVSLDRFASNNNISTLALVKIDVQGAEINVLRGMTNVLKNLRPLIIFEHEDSLHGNDAPKIRAELNAILKNNNYRIYSISSVLLEKYNYAPEVDITHPFEGNLLAIPE